jgi:hypothetical protein
MSSLPPMTTMSLMQNSHNDGSNAALQVLLLFILLWEVTYRIVNYLMCQLLGKTNFTSDKKSFYDTTLSQGQLTTKLQTIQTCGPSYIVSTIHALIVTTRGCIHLIQLWDAPPYDKFVIPPSFALQDDTSTMNYRGAHLLVARTNIIFVSYLLYDVCHVIYQYPKLGKVDTILHHVLFIICSFINGTYGIMAFAFGWLIVGEASTIFLNIRWFLIQLSGRRSIISSESDDTTKCEGRKSSRSLLDTINILFAITFFIVRVIVYTIGVIHLFITHGSSIIMSLPQTTSVPRILLGLTCGCIVLGWGLNLIWGMKIIAMVLKNGNNTKNQATSNKVE